MLPALCVRNVSEGTSQLSVGDVRFCHDTTKINAEVWKPSTMYRIAAHQQHATNNGRYGQTPPPPRTFHRMHIFLFPLKTVDTGVPTPRSCTAHPKRGEHGALPPRATFGGGALLTCARSTWELLSGHVDARMSIQTPKQKETTERDD